MSTLTYSRYSERELINYKRKLRRQREIKRKILLSVLAFVLILFLAFTFSVIISNANEDTSDVSYKYFTSLEIEQGDSLWSIAQEYIDYSQYDGIQDYIDEVIAINHLKSDSIRAGQCIIIPYFSNIYH